MGNCASVDPACATLEHPTGKVEKLDFSSSARQLMLQHPGHYVALLPPSDFVHVKQKLKLLPPDTTLNIGSCYRLVSFEGTLLPKSPFVKSLLKIENFNMNAHLLPWACRCAVRTLRLRKHDSSDQQEASHCL